jgi:hypothetical protein
MDCHYFRSKFAGTRPLARSANQEAAGRWDRRPMETILATFWFLPYYYIVSLGDIFVSKNLWLGLAPWAGVFGLVLGLPWAIAHRQVALGWFLVSPVLSHVMFEIAIYYSPQLNSHDTTWVISAFWLVQLAILIFLVYRAKGMRLPAVALAVFGCSYAYHAGFFSAMALTGAWV